MATKVRFQETECVLDWDGQRWQCEGRQAAHYTDLLNRFIKQGRVTGADPNPPHTHAMRAAEMFGGEVIEFDEPDIDPHAIY